MQYWNQLSRFQRNIIIIIASGVFVALLLLLPSSQSSSSSSSSLPVASNSFAKDLPNHIQITPLKENDANDLASNTARKRKSLGDLVARSGNRQNIGQILGEAKLTREEEEAAIANNVIDNVDNAHNNAIDGVETDRQKDFKGPTNDRQRAVVAAARHAWNGYKEFAWGHDNLKPISMGSHDWFGLGLTIVDSLDTLYIMDMQEGDLCGRMEDNDFHLDPPTKSSISTFSTEYEEARNWVEHYLKFDVNRDMNLFEVTIRVLGGLLSAYHLSGDKMFLTKSVRSNQAFHVGLAFQLKHTCFRSG